MIFCGKATKDRVEFQMSQSALHNLLRMYGQQWEDNKWARWCQLNEEELRDASRTY